MPTILDRNFRFAGDVLSPENIYLKIGSKNIRGGALAGVNKSVGRKVINSSGETISKGIVDPTHRNRYTGEQTYDTEVNLPPANAPEFEELQRHEYRHVGEDEMAALNALMGNRYTGYHNAEGEDFLATPGSWANTQTNPLPFSVWEGLLKLEQNVPRAVQDESKTSIWRD